MSVVLVSKKGKKFLTTWECEDPTCDGKVEDFIETVQGVTTLYEVCKKCGRSHLQSPVVLKRDDNSTYTVH